jgi:membrane protease YdiL (CAAX protease family)
VGLGILGPAVAATILTARESGKAGLKALYGSLLRLRVSLRWYALALLPAGLLTVVLWLLSFAGREGPINYVPGAGALVGGLFISVAEEIGWRGYAQPRLAAKWGAFGAAGLVGLFWYLWHIPMFLGLGVPLDPVLVMLLYFVGGSLLFGFLQERSGQSLLIVVLAHFSAHLNNSNRALPGDLVPLIVQAITYAGLGLFVTRALWCKLTSPRDARTP